MYFADFDERICVGKLRLRAFQRILSRPNPRSISRVKTRVLRYDLLEPLLEVVDRVVRHVRVEARQQQPVAELTGLPVVRLPFLVAGATDSEALARLGQTLLAPLDDPA